MKRKRAVRLSMAIGAFLWLPPAGSRGPCWRSRASRLGRLDGQPVRNSTLQSAGSPGVGLLCRGAPTKRCADVSPCVIDSLVAFTGQSPPGLPAGGVGGAAEDGFKSRPEDCAPGPPRAHSAGFGDHAQRGRHPPRRPGRAGPGQGATGCGRPACLSDVPIDCLRCDA